MALEFEALAELIKGRRSVRRWQEKPVPEEMLLRAIELATWAPNGGNQQNWRFYVILKRATLDAVADAVQSSAALVGGWAEGAQRERFAQFRDRAGFFRQAPAAIAVAAGRYQSIVDLVLEAKEKTDEKAAAMRSWRNTADSRIQSVAAATSYLLLILHQMGLGSVWMTGPVQAKQAIEEILHVPANLDVVAYLPVGYPAESPAPHGRKAVKEVCEIVH